MFEVDSCLDRLVTSWSVVLDYHALYTTGIRVILDGAKFSKELVPVVQKESSVHCIMHKKQTDRHGLREGTDTTAVTSVGVLPMSFRMNVGQRGSIVMHRL